MTGMQCVPFVQVIGPKHMWLGPIANYQPQVAPEPLVITPCLPNTAKADRAISALCVSIVAEVGTVTITTGQPSCLA